MTDDQRFSRWAQVVRDELIPALQGSHVVISLVPAGPPDVKFSVELGLSIMLDKPIMLVVQPGTKVPNKLVLVADLIVEADVTTEVGRAAIQEAVEEITRTAHTDEST